MPCTPSLYPYWLKAPSSFWTTGPLLRAAAPFCKQGQSTCPAPTVPKQRQHLQLRGSTVQAPCPAHSCLSAAVVSGEWAGAPRAAKWDSSPFTMLEKVAECRDTKVLSCSSRLQTAGSTSSHERTPAGSRRQSSAAAPSSPCLPQLRSQGSSEAQTHLSTSLP